MDDGVSTKTLLVIAMAVAVVAVVAFAANYSGVPGEENCHESHLCMLYDEEPSNAVGESLVPAEGMPVLKVIGAAVVLVSMVLLAQQLWWRHH